MNNDQTHILIVDDEPKICQFLEMLLRREGYSAASVYNASDALTYIEQEHCDLVITDLMMPGMDGFEFICRLKAIRSWLPVIMTTGYATVETGANASKVGVDGYITKPFNIDEFRKVVAQTLENRPPRPVEPDPQPAVHEMRRNGSEPARREPWNRARSESISSRVPIRPTSFGPEFSEQAINEHNLDRLLKLALTTLNRKLGIVSSSIMVREGDYLVVRASEGERATNLIGSRQLLHSGVAGHVATEARSFLVKDVENDPVFSPTAGRSYRSKSFVAAAVHRKGVTLGVINAHERRDRRPFDEQDLEALTTLAEEIAPALANAMACREVEERCAQALEALAYTLESKDPYSNGHSRRVAEYAAALARAVGIGDGDIDLLRRAASLHDIGYAGLSDLIMEKPGILDPAERDLVRKHPMIADHILGRIESLHQTRPLVRHHHERVDGGGYPDGLRGKQIPLLARILSIADAFDAMTTARPYRPAMSPDAATREIEAGAGQQFDFELAKVFCERIAPSQRGARD